MTPYPNASLKQILYISFPMMLTSLSGTLMYFIDRLFLANYSEISMNAAASAGMMASLFTYGAYSIAVIAEIFVGQYNGAGEYKKTGRAVWQMIYFSLLLSVLFVPIAYFEADAFLPEILEEEGRTFFRISLGFGSLTPLIGALTAFYIGRGKAIYVTVTALIANGFNAIAAYLLIFGIEGWFEPMGTKGAAIGTVSACAFEVLLLGCVFLSKYNRTHYNTHDYRFDWSIFKKCLRIGSPGAIGHTIEVGAWAALFPIVVSKGLAYTTILTIGQTIFILFIFLMEGLQKGVTSIASNLIGAKDHKLISRLLKNAVIVHFGIVVLLAIPLLLFPESLIELFFSENSTVSNPEVILKYGTRALFWVWVFCAIDGLTWAIAGVFTSAGDTTFIMLSNAFTSWGFAVLPLYFVIQIYDVSPSFSWQLTAFYGAMNLLFFTFRYRSRKWLKFKIHEFDPGVQK
ncbi:MAG: MATE family efflux transporter [Alphaproteobacteria bacterium]|nr:MATE family efflux transporter [Alphaproteobacteria bacterium]